MGEVAVLEVAALAVASVGSVEEWVADSAEVVQVEDGNNMNAAYTVQNKKKKHLNLGGEIK